MINKSFTHKIYIFNLLFILILFFQNCARSDKTNSSISDSNRFIKNEQNGGGEIYPGPGLKVVTFQVAISTCPDGLNSDAIYKLTNLQTNEVKFTFFRKDCESTSQTIDSLLFQWVEENEKFYYENKLFIKNATEATSLLAE